MRRSWKKRAETTCSRIEVSLFEFVKAWSSNRFRADGVFLCEISGVLFSGFIISPYQFSVLRVEDHCFGQEVLVGVPLYNPPPLSFRVILL